jgi:hypothetical protein
MYPLRQGVVRISEIDPAGGDVEQLLALSGGRIGQVDDVEDLGATEARDLHSTHGQEARARPG